MIFEDKVPDPSPLGSTDSASGAEDDVEIIPMEEMLNFMRALNSPEEPDLHEPTGEEMIEAFNRAKEIIEKAVDMNNEGPEGDTPLAVLLNNEVIKASLIAVMMAPQLSDYDKIRFLGAIILVGVKEYNVNI